MISEGAGQISIQGTTCSSVQGVRLTGLTSELQRSVSYGPDSSSIEWSPVPSTQVGHGKVLPKPSLFICCVPDELLPVLFFTDTGSYKHVFQPKLCVSILFRKILHENPPYHGGGGQEHQRPRVKGDLQPQQIRLVVEMGPANAAFKGSLHRLECRRHPNI